MPDPSVLRVADAAARFGAGAVRHRVERGVWQRPCRGVVVLHNGPLGRLEQEQVALASGCPRTALAGPSALRHDGMALRDEAVHVVLPPGARRPSAPGVVVHWSSMLDERDVHPLRSPRRTRPARSVLDTASWSPWERYARWVVVAALQQGVVDVRGLREALTRRGPCRHRGVIVASVLDAVGGVQSIPERDFSILWAALRLPPLGRQRLVRGPDGRSFLDAWCEALGFGVEVHGIPHLAVEHWDADLVRANEIVIAGEHALTFSSYAVRRQELAVADQLVRMARTHGWRGEPDLSALASPRRRRRITKRRGPAAG